nr:MAG TPA: hypothetical protein [Caudoviricetes sp.]
MLTSLSILILYTQKTCLSSKIRIKCLFFLKTEEVMENR